MELKKRRWGEISIAEYDRFTEITESDMSDAEKDVALIALMAEQPEEKVWELPIPEVVRLREELICYKPITYPKNISFKKIQVGDWKCNVETDISKMTYSQFVDFLTYKDKMNTNKAEILSVFFIPQGHKYGDGYDIAQLQRDIRESVSIETFNSVCFFFLRQSQRSLKASAIYLASRMKAMSLLMKKDNPLKEKYREMARLIMETGYSYG